MFLGIKNTSGANKIVTERLNWADALPKKQGLYDPAYEKESCGVGFVCDIKGNASHKIVSDGSMLLCNMTHRGAVGSDARDGDGAGVMTSMPDKFLKAEFKRIHNLELPAMGQYAAGNVFFNPDPLIQRVSKEKFESIAESLGLKVLGWRAVPRDSSLLGPASLSREPVIEQPAVVMDGSSQFDAARFERQLYVLKKFSGHKIGVESGFYICSLSPTTIVYKGQLAPVQVYAYYHDLNNAMYEAHFTLVHSRFATNTFATWRAQPLRLMAHNGEINSLRGNINAQRSREGLMKSSLFGDELEMLYPIVEEGGSDSANFDNVLELLVVNGVVTLPEAVMMMIPEAWENNPNIDPKVRAFYEWASCVMEPWDGPALVAFADGRYCGASLDRNGLRPCRYYITEDRVICGSEVGALKIEDEKVLQKGRLKPGRMLLVDTLEGKIVDNQNLKQKSANRFDFKTWIQANMISLPELKERVERKGAEPLQIDQVRLQADPRLPAFGYTFEQLSLLLAPMAQDAHEALGSMGNDQSLACLSKEPRLVYEYFRQLFAQVTNPPLDPIRERVVMTLACYVGPQGNLLEMSPSQCNRLLLPSPVISTQEFSALKRLPDHYPTWKIKHIDITFAKQDGTVGYEKVLDRICAEASDAIDSNCKVIILSDKAFGKDRIALSSLIALGTVHHHLVRQKQRTQVALLVETAEARESHHMCCLLGYGADGINPYLALESLIKMNREGLFKAGLTDAQVVSNYQKACDDGILKIMSKMGISTLASYKGAQIFEALGIDTPVIDRCFAGTASRIRGVGLEYIAMDAIAMHEQGYPSKLVNKPEGLTETGEYHWRDGGFEHINTPAAIANIQDAVRNKSNEAYAAYAKAEHEATEKCALRGQLDFDFDNSAPVPIEQVEPWTEIVRRFNTGAMSYGSISLEAHTTLAAAMNKLGGKSNSGEGGEDSARAYNNGSGESLRSATKQVASGRFGVTSFYLSTADEIQIKMAQSAKPAEGGELPAGKNNESIARTRNVSAFTSLISPSMHHDQLSIECLKQLIYDLKCANPRARLNVKLVSSVGVGVIATGVAKSKADAILISGLGGGTGAAKWGSIKYASLPWELGLAETHQSLVLNNLRERVTLQTDGQLKTGRDVAMALLLGAEELIFSTSPLIAMGCVMMRACQKDTCPVGIATQDVELRKKFDGTPEHVINFFYYIANELREIMAKLGFRTVDEMIGHTEKLYARDDLKTFKTMNLDLSPLLTPAHALRPNVSTRFTKKQDHELHIRLDNKFIDEAELTLEKGLPVQIEADIVNTDRAVGTTLSYRVSKTFGEVGLPFDTIRIKLKGSAGQSLGAFLAPGITLELEGDANDYVGKGLSGGRIIMYPSPSFKAKANENVIAGNVCLYGATGGSCFLRGIAAERFGVRNSGATAVVEGVGDHGCEYMTGGRVVILGSTGRNFGAGMSGGIAYVLDMGQDFADMVNPGMVGLSNITDPTEIAFVRGLIEDHRMATGSDRATEILGNFNHYLPRFVKVLPHDYKRILDQQKQKLEEAQKTVQSGLLHTVKSDPDADATNGEVERMIASRAGTPKPKHDHEPKLQDMEDAVLDTSKPPVQLDKLRGFMKYKRRAETYREPKSRTKDWAELNTRLTKQDLKYQTARCMDCGVPFCQSDSGCPISNVIPKWNELVFKDQWYDAFQKLMQTNNFPEFTGRVCPAPCEGACVLGINEQPVGIKSVECAIIDHAAAQGWMVPNPPQIRTNKTVAVIGSGPAGLALADQLNKAGHSVTVFERADRIGGLLMYGIPNMKLDKRLVDRRVQLLHDEGIEFVTNTNIGEDIPTEQLKVDYDAVVFTVGSTTPRDLKIPGRELNGVKYAMELLEWNTKSLLENNLEAVRETIEGKKVVVCGGGDTGCDVIGTSVRHAAKSIVNFELLPAPPAKRGKDNPWPQWPRVMRHEYGHQEVAARYGKDPREYCILSKKFVGDEENNLTGIETVRVEWKKTDSGVWQMSEIPNSEELIEADVCLLAMGFIGPEAANLQLPLDKRGNIQANNVDYHVDENVFTAGDCRRGQSLIVWAIAEGRNCAVQVDKFLTNEASLLPTVGGIIQREWSQADVEKAKMAQVKA